MSNVKCSIDAGKGNCFFSGRCVFCIHSPNW